MSLKDKIVVVTGGSVLLSTASFPLPLHDATTSAAAMQSPPRIPMRRTVVSVDPPLRTRKLPMGRQRRYRPVT